MNEIKIRKKNETYLQIDADAGILMELYEHFSFHPPGYKFHPSFKARRWDGLIRLVNLGNRCIYAGLLPQVEEFLKSKGYDYQFEANGYYGMPREENNIGYEDIESFAKSLNLHSNGKPIEIRDYQINAIVSALRNKRQLVVAPTGSGKSCLLYVLCRYIQEKINPDFRFLIIVPTTSLVQQMYGDFNDYSSHNDFSANESIHKITGGEDKHTNKHITVSTWQSIFKLQSKYFNQFDVIICDEAHKLQSNSIVGIYEKATEVQYRFGCTGTLNDTKCHAMVLTGLTGQIVQVTTTKELQDKGQLSELDIKCILLRHSEEVRLAFKKADYDQEIGYIVTNERRNKFIAKLASQTEGTTLVLFRFVEKQGKQLYRLIQETEKNREVFLITGATPSEERERIRQHANKHPSIVIASLGTTAAGVNLPAIENIIFAHPSKAKITNLQSIGRGLRLSDGKTKCTLYDIADDLSYKKAINYTLRHMGERIKVYTKEKFKFNIIKLDI